MDVITTHINAEFDSFASMIAARRLFPEALMVFPGAQERNLRLFLENYPHHYQFRRMRSVRLERIKRLVIVDTRRSDRIGRFSEILQNKDLEIHIYDHHPPSPHDIKGSAEWIRETGSSTTMFVELFQEKQMRITPREATIFGLGIYEDTGSLSFISTTPADIRAAAYLLECGLDLKIVSDYISRELTPEQVSLLNDLLKSREFVDANGLKVAVATAARDHFVGDLAVLGHKMKDIENLNVLFLLVKMHDRIHLVARSRIEAVDAGEIASALGGGGHPTAASAVIRQKDLTKAKKKLIAVIKEKAKPIYLARDLMSSTLMHLSFEAVIDDAREIMGRFGIDHLPVLKNGVLEGIIHREAIIRAVRHGLGDRPATDFMDTGFETLSPGDPYYRIQDLFLNHGHHFLPVVEEGKLVGAITRSDLLGILREEADMKPAYRFGAPDAMSFKISRNVAGLIEERLPLRIVNIIENLGVVSLQMGVSAYLVGGFVRDLILNLPNLDLDVVVEGDGIAFARKVAKQNGGRVRSHKKFETAVVILEDGFKIDIATSRMEYYEQPGALPKVVHGSIKMDLYRRDFSINALAIKLSGPEFGRLIDFFGSQKDIEEGVIRVLHDLSFVDDPTRIFRAVRFEQRLNFTIGEHTLKLMANAVKSNLVETIAGPRLLGELKGILKEKRPSGALLRLQELDLLRMIHPALASFPIDVPLLDRLMEIVNEYRTIVPAKFEELIIYLAVLTRQFTLEEINYLSERTGMPPGPSGLLMDIYVGHRRLATLLDRTTLLPSEVYRIAASYPLETVFFTIGCYPNTAIEVNLRRHLGNRFTLSAMLSGDDLKLMGYVPGPKFRKILDAVLDAQLNGEISNPKQAESWVKKKYRSERRIR